MTLRQIFVTAAVCSSLSLPSYAGDFISAGKSWTSSWSFSSTSEKAYRLNLMAEQKKLEEGYYDGISGTATTNYYDDRSIGDMSVTAADGASVSFDLRTGEESGTKSTSIGATNTTTSTISIDGDSNMIGIDSYATSEGCQDGSIQMATAMVDGVDISATAAEITNGGSTCN